MQSNSVAELQTVSGDIPGIETSKGPKLVAAKDLLGIKKLAIMENTEINAPIFRFILRVYPFALRKCQNK